MIYFTGDICLCDKAFDIGFGVGSQVAKGTIKPFAKLNKKEGDIWVANFEGVVSEITNRKDYTGNSFRINCETFDRSESIIDYWGIANNHVMEHGGEAYQQMEAFLTKKSKGVFGSQKRKTVCFECEGKKIAVSGFCLRAEDTPNEALYWYLPGPSEIETEFDGIKAADVKVAYIHWGVEYVDYPYGEQQKLAHWLVDLGYDLIVGMHPHVLQGFEVYKGKYIFYSLGNFVFSMPYQPSTYSAVVTLDLVSGACGYKYVHITKDCCPEIVSEVNVPTSFRFDSLNKKIGKEENIERYISVFNQGLKAYRKSNNKEIMNNAFKFKPSILVKIIKSFIKRRLHYAH